jgi:hypothetical protein
MIVLTNLNLNKNELQSAVIHPLAAAPSSPVDGQIYYNTVDDHIWYRSNGAWVDVTNALTLGGTAAASYALLASPTFTGTPAAPTAGAGTNTTQIATTAYVVAEILARLASNDAMLYKGAIDASSNPNYPAGDAGDTYRISVAGKIGGASGPNVEVGDMIILHVDGSAAGTQAAVGANWDIIQTNIDGAVTVDGVQTLTNKTLTAPKFADLGFIADANGNEMIIFDTVATAINEITLANAASGGNPKLSATGGGTDIGIDFQAKGTGAYNFFGTTTASADIRLFEDTDNGSNYVSLKAPALVSSNAVLTLPGTTDTLVGRDTTDTLTNKTLTTPTIASFTNATHNHTNAAGGGTIPESALALTDITTNNATASAHGFLPKLSGNATEFLNGGGTFSTPAGSGVAKFAQNVGDGVTTVFVITHSLGTRSLAYSVAETATPWANVIADVEFTSTTTATVRFAVAPTTNQYNVTFVG